jgi:hypothetical protein
MTREELACAPVCATKEETWVAAENIMRIIDNSGPLYKALNIIRYNGFYIKKNLRSIKTHWHCQIQHDNPVIVPEISLHGKWLQQKGFERGDKIWVLPFSELLIIIPQGAKK